MTPTETIKQAIEIDKLKNERDSLLHIIAECRDAAGPWYEYPEAMGSPDEVPAKIANLRAENESLRLELGKWRGWLAENKAALKQARADALREAADYLESYEFQKTISPSQHYPESAELRRMADEIAKNKH